MIALPHVIVVFSKAIYQALSKCEHADGYEIFKQNKALF
jgi:hypothetical protein